ncbi:anti-sigma factor family protein [Candidatus Frankia nodulisporulans]|uniref:anti-sigma factor family protein n=1 Tax=Candidatus Frankia nodulisporulans TaxID=2060052 RepID=UPI0013D23F3D|nr:zf-HC2 domain-containing protein [Candidatus Frankia nodulisporulans]
MTEHLGDRISPLIDHELDHDARDRALAHLAGCDPCQREVIRMRALKAQLVTLRDPAMSDAFVARLRGLGAVPPAAPVDPPSSRPVAAGQSGVGTGTETTRVARVATPRRPAVRRDRPAGRARGSHRPLPPPMVSRSRGSAPRPDIAGRSGPRRPNPAERGRRPLLARPTGPRRSTVRRTLLGSAALLVLAMTGTAVGDVGGSTRPGGSVAVPTVSSVVAPGPAAGGSLRLIPMFSPMRVSFRR